MSEYLYLQSNLKSKSQTESIGRGKRSPQNYNVHGHGTRDTARRIARRINIRILCSVRYTCTSLKSHVGWFLGLICKFPWFVFGTTVIMTMTAGIGWCWLERLGDIDEGVLAVDQRVPLKNRSDAIEGQTGKEGRRFVKHIVVIHIGKPFGGSNSKQNAQLTTQTRNDNRIICLPHICFTFISEAGVKNSRTQRLI